MSRDGHLTQGSVTRGADGQSGRARCGVKGKRLRRLLPQRVGCILILTGLGHGLWAGVTDEITAQRVAARLEADKHAIAVKLTAMLKANDLKASYTVVWRAYEDAIIEALKQVLPQHIPELDRRHFDAGQTGQEKNRPADFAIVCGPDTIEVSIKSARKSANPENDLGTFREHPNRKRLFAGSFTVWVRYDDSSGEAIRCDRVFLDRTWRFVGRATAVDGVKYRKKDGNMRPKPWGMFDTGTAYWNTE